MVPFAKIGQEIISGSNRTKQPGKLPETRSSTAAKTAADIFIVLLFVGPAER